LEQHPQYARSKVKYVGEEHLDHLLNAIKQHYEVTEDRTGGLYCGITLEWDYKKRTLDISMPGYVQKQLAKYNHEKPKKPQHCPWEPAPIKYGSKSQETDQPDTSPPLDKAGIQRIQQIVGSFLYYSRATDPTIPHALNKLSSQQSKATEETAKRAAQFLDYMATHPDAKIRYHASDIASNARSRADGYFFLGSVPKDGQPIKLNGCINVLCTVLKLVAASAAEAELGALFLNAKEAKVMRITLEELGHCQPPTPIHIDNSTTVGIVNNTIKRQKSRSMEMRYFWLLDGAINKLFDFKYQPGLENLADYPSKAHPGSHHLEVRPYYVHTDESPRFLLRAAKPSVRRGCVNKPRDTYVRKYPLPSITRLPRVSQTQILVAPAG
jgi:hypothetical protein